MLAVLYDIHGNLPALEAVLDDVRADDPDGYVLGGDYAVFGGWPRETVDRLRGIRDARWLRGNVDRWCRDREDAPGDPVVQQALAACAEALDEGRVAELAALPPAVVVNGSRFVHASPVSDVRSFVPEPSEDDAELLDGVTEPRLVFGHTHLPFQRRSGDVELINPGSVGMPFDGDPRAAYAVIAEDGTVEHRRVAYDHERSAARVSEVFGDSEFTRVVAERIRRARFDVGAGH
jgi:predicted phosphodiesterase